MRIRKSSKRQARYIPLSDVEKINDRYLTEMQNVKQRLGYVKDEAIIRAFHDVLLSSYNAVIELQTLEREVDYEIRLAKIEERRRNQIPWRRCWLWRLLLRPLTNRAQDIIEARAELEADILHTEAENAIEDERKKLPQDSGESLSKRKLKRAMRDKLKAVIKAADKADVKEAFAEPQNVPTVQENADTPAAPTNEAKPAQEPQEQLRLDELPPVQTRRPRPPKDCRKPRT
ncbi:MAG: hypothetical protein K2O41_00535 [Clostridia bacterium]|nr:hypothetical protein [Clostridia bacterium]